MRQPSSDTPSRVPRTRIARVRFQRADGLYAITFDKGSGVAYSNNPVTPGGSYPVTREPEKDMWRIEAPGSSQTYYDAYVSDMPSDDWTPAASPAQGTVVWGSTPRQSFADLRVGSIGAGTYGGEYGPGRVGVRLRANFPVGTGTLNTWQNLGRGIAAWNFGIMPVGTVIKSAELTMWPDQVYSDFLSGGEIGWVQSNKPITNDGGLSISNTDYTLTGDTLTPLLTNLLSIDDIVADQPGAGSSYPFDVLPPQVTWEFTSDGVAYLQDVFDSPSSPDYRKVQMKLLLEWDRTNTAPTWAMDADLLAYFSGGIIRSDDGLIQRSPRIRVFV